ncbi:hypothetical protein C8035_v011053 [Colletotrichum spinosum]|uniref:F-box domain-containing protein n=1 Tax=Colletotrichum spinosum TaxID=1347390 RepID=A0A4R8Q2Z2_9PEZI|nr:hypothetical protein C8035_v011053 [Colletotrichum spinosum]
MVTAHPTAARLKCPKDWPAWFLQLRFQAHQHNVWEHFDPEATDTEDPMRRIPRPPTLDEMITKRQNELQERDTRDLDAAGGKPGFQRWPPIRVTDLDVREEYTARLADYNAAVTEREEVLKGYRIVSNWVYSTVEITVLSDAQVAATAAGDPSMQGIVRALRSRLAHTKRSVLRSLFFSFGILDDFRKHYLSRRSKAQKPTTSSFLRLPTEILCIILDCLELHDQFILGQACKELRAVIQRDWTLMFDRLPSVKKQAFLTGLAFTMPNHWACGLCHKLHHINKHDIPGAKPYNGCPYDERGAKFAYVYEVRERYVQLALKFKRLEAVNQDYLGKIMSPFTYKLDFITRPISKHFKASPKVTTERFLLHTRLKLVYRKGLSVGELDDETICPHMMVCSTGTPQSQLSGPKNFGNDVRLAFAQPGKEIQGHCPRCPADYSIIVGSNRITIDAWYDFGSHKSPNDKSWTTHVRSSQNLYSTGPTVYHDPGSIRRLYVMSTGVP